MSYVVTCERKLGYRELRWLLLALGLHALLLLIPSSELPQRPLSPPAELVLRLMSLPVPSPVTPEPVREESIEDEPEAIEPDALPEAQPEVTDAVAEPEESFEAPRSRMPVSAARLMGLKDGVTERVPAPADSGSRSLDLGAPRPFERPHNWHSGAGAEALAPFDNTFNGKTVPGEAVIVDRWLAADGSHNVIVETPNGLRMCGRAQALDPTRPLIEPVMMWHICGGDGARPFEFRPREPRNRDFIVPDPVVKDATEP